MTLLNAPFKIGETVELKSHVLKMTVEAIRKNGRVRCVWIDSRFKVHRATFQADTLERPNY